MCEVVVVVHSVRREPQENRTDEAGDERLQHERPLAAGQGINRRSAILWDVHAGLLRRGFTVKYMLSMRRFSLTLIMAAFVPACTTNVPAPGGGGPSGPSGPSGGTPNQSNVEATVQEQLSLERV